MTDERNSGEDIAALVQQLALAITTGQSGQTGAQSSKVAFGGTAGVLVLVSVVSAWAMEKYEDLERSHDKIEAHSRDIAEVRSELKIMRRELELCARESR